MNDNNETPRKDFIVYLSDFLKENSDKQKKEENRFNKDNKEINDLETDVNSLLKLLDINNTIGQITEKQNTLEKSVNELKQDNKLNRNTIIVTAIAAVLAVGALNYAQISNMFSAYEFGTKSTEAYRELKKDIEEIKLQLQRQTVVTQSAQQTKEPTKK